MMNSKPADTSPDTMDIVGQEDEVVGEAAEKIAADLKKFDDRAVGHFGASKFPGTFPVENVKLLGSNLVFCRQQRIDFSVFPIWRKQLL